MSIAEIERWASIIGGRADFSRPDKPRIYVESGSADAVVYFLFPPLSEAGSGQTFPAAIRAEIADSGQPDVCLRRQANQIFQRPEIKRAEAALGFLANGFEPLAIAIMGGVGILGADAVGEDNAPAKIWCQEEES